ncbi:heterokaryon incompatibility protein-domain-containing protein [Clohesyomyces aquaticus]|uniref:Heterokaryon incompatibility protein-domain-containing protein n=1 Tax=Clohesyomyces aquaticus TaxID=1231657 RepID=A0A1Y1YGM5_9PLEO|nr:heterokaryon incompatibility protein-domain-containing protein [Clohesyomyces aquaticus]
MVICKLCNDQEKKDEDDVRLAFDFTPAELVQSARGQDCSSCAVILEGLRRSTALEWDFEQDVRRVYARCRGMHKQKPTTLSLVIYFEDERPKLEIEFISLKGGAWKAVLPGYSVSDHPLSPKALNWVKSRLTACIEQHDLCRNSIWPRLPKRVLSLLPGQGSRVEVKLMTDHHEYAPYAALSHRWGDHQTCVTNTSTLRKHEEGIPWEAIPRTFRDAMRFALKLNIPYIWIDSLCIIQDDALDWEIESSKMAEIYENSYLTLAATASPNDSQGCFTNPTGDAAISEWHIPRAYPDTCLLAARKPIQHWDTLLLGRLLQRFPLLSRAWVFQERLLSPRVLHFCGSELVWECRVVSSCECGGICDARSPGGEFHQALRRYDTEYSSRGVKLYPDLVNPLDSVVKVKEDELKMYYPPPEYPLPEGNEEIRSGKSRSGGIRLPRWIHIPGRNRHVTNHRPASSKFPQDRGQMLMDAEIVRDREHRLEELRRVQLRYEQILQDLKEETMPSEVSQQWRNLVEQYSALQITKPTDRLPALSGLCERVKPFRGDYMAGLWADSIWLDLLWRVDTIQAGRGRFQRSHYQRPSWSWVSVEDPVSYWDDIMHLSLGPPSSYFEEARPFPNSFIVREMRRRALQFRYDIQLAGLNTFGEVASAVLTIISYHQAAIIRPVDDDTVDSILPPKYKIDVDGTEMHFHADHALAMEGHANHSNAFYVDKMVELLLIHPQIALVLTPSKDQPGASPHPIGEWSLGEGPQRYRDSQCGNPSTSADSSSPGFWERIGIVRVSDTLLDLYQEDWMRWAVVAEFNII